MCIRVSSSADRGVPIRERQMARFFRFVDQHYPQTERIFVALDNWFVHSHLYVLDYLSNNCPRIELVPLPTYAPWTNPMEKVWLKLYRELLYLHPYDDDWQGFKQAIEDWLAQYSTGYIHHEYTEFRSLGSLLDDYRKESYREPTSLRSDHSRYPGCCPGRPSSYP